MFRASGTLLKKKKRKKRKQLRCTYGWSYLWDVQYIYFLHIKYKYKSIYLFIAKTLFCNELEVIWTVDSTEKKTKKKKTNKKKKKKKKNNCNERDNKIVLLSRTHCERLFLLG